MFNRISEAVLKMKEFTKLIVSLGLLLIIGFLDFITGPELSFSIFYLLPITFASWFISSRSGAILALFSTVVWFLSDFFYSRLYSHPVVPYWNAIVMLGIFSFIMLLTAKLKAVFDKENMLALDIQMGLLPDSDPEIPGVMIISTWQPAAAVSGDYYDYIQLDKARIGIALGDICGHGFPAALLMSNLQAAFRLLTRNILSPASICRELNEIITGYKVKGRFTSFFYGVFNTESKEFIYANAGHPFPVIIRDHREIIRLSENGMLLGVMSHVDYEDHIVRLQKDDILIMFTDGAVEIKDKNNTEFGEERLIEICEKNITHSPNNFSANILYELNEFSRGLLEDDVTIIVLQVV